MPNVNINVLRRIYGDSNFATKVNLGGITIYERIVETSSYDTATQALLDQATTDGYTAPSGTTLTALDTFITTLKSTGIWALCDVIYLPATNGDSDFACYNLKNPATFKLTKVNSPTFTSLQGFTGNGSSSYLNTGWNPSTNGVNYTLNSASLGGYARTDNTDGTQRVLIGVTDATGFTQFTPKLSTTAFLWGFQRINNAGVNFKSYNGITNANGFYNSNRFGSGANDLNLYRNGSSLTVNQNGSIPSTNVPNNNVYLLASNNNGTAAGFSREQLSFAYFGADLTAQASSFYSAIQTYMTTLGTNV